MDEEIFRAHWHTLAGDHPLPDLPMEGIQQSSPHEDKGIEAVSAHSQAKQPPDTSLGDKDKQSEKENMTKNETNLHSLEL